MARRGVHEPPKSAARGLISWAVDLWPYVNGKALTQGLQLSAMNASDMVDVLHFYFEEDMNVVSNEQAEAKSKSRVSIYKTLYDREYKYEYKGSSKQTPKSPEDYETEDGPDMADIKPFDPKKEPTKAYFAPTDFDPESSNPFGNGLDAPMR